MKKFFKILSVIFLLLFTACGSVTYNEVRRALEANLKKRYGKEFHIGFGGRRGFTVGNREETWYEFQIKPAAFSDEYYSFTGNVDIKKGIFGEKIDFVGDLYREILLNVSANEFYLPKLKEIFGENVLPIFYVDSGYIDEFPEFEKEMKDNLGKGRHIYVDGKIIVFGRVENDSDRKKYQEKIYEFIEYVKSQGFLEWTDLSIYIVDERILADNALSYINTLDKIRDVNEDFKILDEPFKNTSKERMKEKIESFPKKEIFDTLNRYHGYLLSANVSGEMALENNLFLNHNNKEEEFRVYGKPTYAESIGEYSKRYVENRYSSPEDIIFSDSISDEEIVDKENKKMNRRYYLDKELVWEEEYIINETAIDLSIRGRWELKYEKYYKDGKLYVFYDYLNKFKHTYDKDGKIIKTEIIKPSGTFYFENDRLVKGKYGSFETYFLDDGRLKVDNKYYSRYNNKKFYAKDIFLPLENGKEYIDKSHLCMLLDGEYTEYFGNTEKIFKKCFYKDGILDGEYLEYDLSGNITKKCFYKDGLLDGECVEYSSGKEKKRTVYENGVKIK